MYIAIMALKIIDFKLLDTILKVPNFSLKYFQILQVFQKSLGKILQLFHVSKLIYNRKQKCIKLFMIDPHSQHNSKSSLRTNEVMWLVYGKCQNTH